MVIAGILILLAACAAAPAAPEVPPAAQMLATPFPTNDPLFQSNGGGDPRGTGYWLVWNTCVDGNQAQTAKANGGRAAGWVLVDDLLLDPGMLVGSMEIKTCAQAAAILQAKPATSGAPENAPFYQLASQLLAAQLNLAVPAETCLAVEKAVQSAQLLLLSVGFNGDSTSMNIQDPDKDPALAGFLAGQLSSYNAGQLCR